MTASTERPMKGMSENKHRSVSRLSIGVRASANQRASVAELEFQVFYGIGWIYIPQVKVKVGVPGFASDEHTRRCVGGEDTKESGVIGGGDVDLTPKAFDVIPS